MFCTNCGSQVADSAKFCNQCGHKIEIVVSLQTDPFQNNKTTETQDQIAPEPAQPKIASAAIPFHLKKGLIKTEAYIAMFNQTQAALIFIGNERYKQITASGKPETGGYFKKVAGMMQAYKNFAETFEFKSISDVLSEFPGSILIDNSQIKSIRIYHEYDSNNQMQSSDYTLEIHSSNGKYKGTLERGFEPRSITPYLRSIFGKNFKF